MSIEALAASAFRIPTEEPESDGTLRWDATALVTVELEADGRRGLGYTYGSAAAARLVVDELAPLVLGADPQAARRLWDRLVRSIRNLGRPGICSAAIAAVDAACWDLKARLLELPLVRLLGGRGDPVPCYGSGGFTSSSEERLREQLGSWAEAGFPRVKMKVGREPAADPRRVRAAREAIGDDVGLMVDANGAYDRKQALDLGRTFAEFGVDWFEEPVSSDDLEGLRLLCNRLPAPTEVAAGEYGYDLFYFRRMLDACAVDVLQVDATRCAGITGFMDVAALCRARSIPLSAHTAPALHLHPCSALGETRHMEWFQDHARIERKFFDGAVQPERGLLRPDLSRSGHGLGLRRDELREHQVFHSEARP